jgi:hypothetical protein
MGSQRKLVPEKALGQNGDEENGPFAVCSSFAPFRTSIANVLLFARKPFLKITKVSHYF